MFVFLVKWKRIEYDNVHHRVCSLFLFSINNNSIERLRCVDWANQFYSLGKGKLLPKYFLCLIYSELSVPDGTAATSILFYELKRPGDVRDRLKLALAELQVSAFVKCVYIIN